MARASQRGPQRLVVNAEQVLYRQKESVRTIQVLGTVGTNESAQSTEAQRERRIAKGQK